MDVSLDRKEGNDMDGDTPIILGILTGVIIVAVIYILIYCN
jgi:hypothetical protein